MPFTGPPTTFRMLDVPSKVFGGHKCVRARSKSPIQTLREPYRCLKSSGGRIFSPQQGGRRGQTAPGPRGLSGAAGFLTRTRV